jgi:hypothetical protein
LDVVLYDLPLEPVVLDQWLGFVHKRLHDCGLEGTLPLTADEVADAQVAAGDNIGQMLMELEQALSTKTQIEETPSLRLGLPPLHFVAVIALLAVLLIVGITGERFFGGGNEEPEVAAQQFPLEPPADLSNSDDSDELGVEQPDRAVGIAFSSERESDVANGDQVPALTEPAPVVVSDTPVASQPDVSSTQVQQPVEQEQINDEPSSAPSDTRSDSQIQSQSVVEAIEPPTELVSQEPEEGGPTDDRARLQAVADEHFVLQIMAAQNLVAVRAFIEQQDNREDLALITQDRSGQNWYVVITGDYRTQALARAAIATLPKSQQSNGPWPRNALELKQYLAED